MPATAVLLDRPPFARRASLAARSPLARPAARVALGEVLAALSHALDLTEGQPAGHTLRSCVIGLRLADALGLDDDARVALHYALLLKDAGCSSNASRMAALFGGDDRAIKPRMKAVDWHRRARLAVTTFRNTGVGGGLRARVRHFARVATTPDVTRDLIAVRCDRGAGIARGLGFPEATACAIRSLDEHWCGAGYPDGLAGDAIPLLARIANLAQTVETFHSAHGVHAALRVVRERRGTWFDPRLADVVLGWARDDAWWASLATPATALRAGEVHPRELRWLDDEGLDQVAEAFAGIIDAKSPYTSRHSTDVARHAAGIARASGATPAEERMVRRAGLLHDIGKLGVSNAVLDKPGPLTAEERRAVERHPLHTWEILSRVTAFADFAWTAALHHEKLDGSGYPWGLDGDRLDRWARVLTVADIYEALTADRPYRAGMSPREAIAIISRDRGARLDGEAIDALVAYVG